MKIKHYLLAIPAIAMLSCGGSDEGSNDEGSEGENTSYHSTFETCPTTNNVKMTDNQLNESDAFAFEKMKGINLSTFTNYNAELTKSHKSVRVKFTNNSEILNAGIGQFNPGDISLTIVLKPKSGEVVAGEYSDADADISFTKGEKIDGTSKTGDIGSNKISNLIVINEISEDHVCGTLTMNNAEGISIVSATFDTKVKMVSF